MAQAETEILTRILWNAALSRAVSTIAELGIADQIEAGSPQSVESLSTATGTHERSFYRTDLSPKGEERGLIGDVSFNNHFQREDAANGVSFCIGIHSYSANLRI